MHYADLERQIHGFGQQVDIELEHQRLVEEARSAAKRRVPKLAPRRPAIGARRVPAFVGAWLSAFGVAAFRGHQSHRQPSAGWLLTEQHFDQRRDARLN